MYFDALLDRTKHVYYIVESKKNVSRIRVFTCLLSTFETKHCIDDIGLNKYLTEISVNGS